MLPEPANDQKIKNGLKHFLFLGTLILVLSSARQALLAVLIISKVACTGRI